MDDEASRPPVDGPAEGDLDAVGAAVAGIVDQRGVETDPEDEAVVQTLCGARRWRDEGLCRVVSLVVTTLPLSRRIDPEFEARPSQGSWTSVVPPSFTENAFEKPVAGIVRT